MAQSKEDENREKRLKPLWVKMVCLSAGYFLGAWLSRFLAGGHSTLVGYWLPGGLFVAVLLLSETKEWPWLMVAVVPANALFDWLHDPSPNVAVIYMFCICNLLQSGVGAWLVRKFVAERPTMRSLGEFVGLIFFSGFVGSALGASIGAAMLSYFQLTDSFGNAWRIMWSGNLMAVLVLTPLVLVFFGSQDESPRSWPVPRILEGGLILGGMAAFIWYVMVRGGGIESPKAPALFFSLWAGVRFGLRGGTLTVFSMALWMAFLTTHYHLGLSAEAIASRKYAFTLQVFVAIAAIVGIVPAILLNERDRAIAKLRESEEKFSKAFRASPDGLCITDMETGRFVEVNEGYSKLHGYSPEEMLGKTSTEMGFWENPDDRPKLIERLKTTGTIRDMEIRTRTRNGDFRVVHLSAEVIELDEKKRVVTVLHDVTDRVRAEQMNQSQRHVLEMIAGGQPMTQTLDTLLRMVESQSKGMLSSILLLDADGVHIRHAAAPSLPAGYIQAIDGRAIGPCAGSCGTAAFRGAPVFVADIANNPLWTEYKEFALPYGLRACWSTPIFDAQRKVLGTFAIYYRRPGLPDEQHRQLINMVTHTAAICISRHRAEADREQAVAREKEARIEYTLQLIAEQEAERKRIAADLHDSMGQNLLLIKNLAEMSLRSTVPAQMYDHAGTINHLAVQCIEEARRISRDLHPHQLDHLGLKRALEAMLEQAAQASQIQFVTKIELVDDLFSAEAAMNLYRIVQESLNNILKHSGASRLNIRLERDIHEVELRIEDNGTGFDLKRAEERKGLGLRNITERARMLGGVLKIESSPGNGTGIEVKIPIASAL